MNRKSTLGNRTRRLPHIAGLLPHIAGLLLLLVMLGCGGTDRQALRGTITLDGKPLPLGTITLKPQQGTRSPTASSEVSDGKFFIPAKNGLHVGQFHVEVLAMRVKNGDTYDPSKAYEYNQIEQYLPQRYNYRSELLAEIKKGKNSLDFELQSK